MVTLLFTIEYLARIVTTERKLRYIFSFYGIIDLLAILPFYLSLGFDLQGIKAFRLFRIFRILKGTRYGKEINRLGEALVAVKAEFVLFLIVLFILLYISAIGIYYCEHQAQPENFASIFHSLWWAVITLTTVGYGDVYPITICGKLFTFLILMGGRGHCRRSSGGLSPLLYQLSKTPGKDET